MHNLNGEPLWLEYERAEAAFVDAMNKRRQTEANLKASFSDDALRQWDDAHRSEEQSYEKLKAAERAVWAKFHNV